MKLAFVLPMSLCLMANLAGVNVAPAFADGYEDCVINLDHNTGNAQGDAKLRPGQLAKVCTLPYADRVSDCINYYDSKTNLTAQESFDLCIKNPSEAAKRCVSDLREKTGTARSPHEMHHQIRRRNEHDREAVASRVPARRGIAPLIASSF